ncbi:MAG: hypothetical protein H7X77_05270, partial [Anaerolineae bacterium]|nr:hypothetical protein [Anaerolineae bacterium]
MFSNLPVDVLHYVPRLSVAQGVDQPQIISDDHTDKKSKPHKDKKKPKDDKDKPDNKNDDDDDNDDDGDDD